MVVKHKSTKKQDGDIPQILPAQADDQIVFLKKGGSPDIIEGSSLEGPVIATKGGIQYTVGGKDSSFTEEDPKRLKRLLELEEQARQGNITATTPAEIFENGVDGDRTKICVEFTSGGESPAIGAHIARVAEEMGKTHVVLGAWRGFKAGVAPRDEFAKSLVVINDPRVLDRMSHVGGSPFGMSRIKIDSESPEEKRLLDNCDGVGIVDGTTGGDHTEIFRRIYEAAKKRGQRLIVGVTPKSIDQDLSIKTEEGTKNSLMLGHLTTVHGMRKRWFNEIHSAAGNRKCAVGFFFGRGAGWTVLGAIRCDDEFVKRMRADGILTDDLENKQDTYGGRQMGLVPEFPVSIPFFVREFNERLSKGRENFVGVAASEGFMFKELAQEYHRLRSELESGRLQKEILNLVLRADSSGIDFQRLIQDSQLRKVFEHNPEIGREFLNVVVNPKLDVWGHPYMDVMPKIVDAMIRTLTNAKDTNYFEIKYHSRVEKVVPADRKLAESTAELKAEKLRAGKSGLTTLTYEDGEDPLLIDTTTREPVFIPFEQIRGMSERHNNLLTLDKDYLRRCGILIED